MSVALGQSVPETGLKPELQHFPIPSVESNRKAIDSQQAAFYQFLPIHLMTLTEEPVHQNALARNTSYQHPPSIFIQDRTEQLKNNWRH